MLTFSNLSLSYGSFRALEDVTLHADDGELVVLLGAASLIEMIYHLQLNSSMGAELHFLGATLNTGSVDSWFGAGFWVPTAPARVPCSGPPAACTRPPAASVSATPNCWA